MKNKRLIVMCICSVVFIGATGFMLADTDKNEGSKAVAQTEGTESISDETKVSAIKTTKKHKETTGNQTTTKKEIESNAPKTKKTIKEVAEEVLNGLWGSGEERQKSLEKAGYDYDEVQAEVNKIDAERKLSEAYVEDEVIPITRKPGATSEKSPETTKSNKKEDLSKLGTKSYGDTARAGLYYDDNGNRTTYDEIAEGEWYYYYDSYGEMLRLQKPYSKGNEPAEYRDYCILCGYKLAGTKYYGANNCPSCKGFIGYGTAHLAEHCEYCGKKCEDVNGQSACELGGCTRWIKDVTCANCGKKVPAHTCHTCKK